MPEPDFWRRPVGRQTNRSAGWAARLSVWPGSLERPGCSFWPSASPLFGHRHGPLASRAEAHPWRVADDVDDDDEIDCILGADGGRKIDDGRQKSGQRATMCRRKPFSSRTKIIKSTWQRERERAQINNIYHWPTEGKSRAADESCYQRRLASASDFLAATIIIIISSAEAPGINLATWRGVIRLKLNLFPRTSPTGRATTRWLVYIIIAKSMPSDDFLLAGAIIFGKETIETAALMGPAQASSLVKKYYFFFKIIKVVIETGSVRAGGLALLPAESL